MNQSVFDNKKLYVFSLVLYGLLTIFCVLTIIFKLDYNVSFVYVGFSIMFCIMYLATLFAIVKRNSNVLKLIYRTIIYTVVASVFQIAIMVKNQVFGSFDLVINTIIALVMLIYGGTIYFFSKKFFEHEIDDIGKE